MSNFNNASLIVTPNSYKAGKLYSIIPTNGAGDLDVVRATSATRVNSAGLIESVGANIPRLDYANGSCPSMLIEPQRTNLVFPSAIATTQTRTVTATSHTLSFYGTGSVVLSGVATGTLVGTGANNKVTLTFTPTAGSLILTVTGSVTNWQLEAGSNATSYIPTTTTSVTRNADVISKSGISSLIGQTEGTIYLEAYNTPINEGFKSLIILYKGTDIAGNSISVSTGNGGDSMRLSVSINGVNATTLTFTLTGDQLNKICITYTSSTAKVFLNGVQRGGTLSVTGPYTLDRLDLGNRSAGRQWGAPIYDTFISKTALSDAEAIQLTTL